MIAFRDRVWPTPYEEAKALDFELRGDVKPQLQHRCRQKGIRGYSRMNKTEMRHAIIRKELSWSKDWSEDWLAEFDASWKGLG